MIFKKIIVVLIAFSLTSCLGSNGSKKQSKQIGIEETAPFEIKYAKGYELKKVNGIDLLDITDPTGSNPTIYRYALVPKDSANVVIPDGYSKIATPIERVVCMTTLQLSPFIKLEETDRIVGVTSTRFLQNNALNERLESKKLSRIGIEGEFDTEVVLSITPDVIFISPYKRGGYDAIKNLDIPMLSYLGYKEPSPLGQAEWIKLVGLLTGESEKANAKFDSIETRYNELRDRVKDVAHRPKVMSGELHSGNWYVVGGKSCLAQQFEDAGASYFLVDNEETGGFYIDFETVYSQGYDSDYWRVVNSFKGEYSYDEIRKSNNKYTDFKPYKNKGVIYCNLGEKPYYENSPMEPEVILADLIKIFHSDKMSDHEAVYYKILE